MCMEMTTSRHPIPDMKECQKDSKLNSYGITNRITVCFVRVDLYLAVLGGAMTLELARRLLEDQS